LFYYPDAVLYFDPSKSDLKYQQKQIETPDGEKIVMWNFDPLDPTEEKGTILHFHGNAQNMSSHVFFVIWLIEHGYRVIAFDYRGYGGSTGTPDREGLVIDGRTVIEEVCRSTKSPLFIIAQSLGGAVAVPALAKSKPNCACALILDSTFASYRDMARDMLDRFFLTWPFQYPLSFLISEDESPLDYVNQISMPILMIHGDQDPIVPIEEGLKLYQSMTNSSKEFWTVQDGGHTSAFAEESPYIEKMIGYLDQRSKHCKNSD
jgi:pimeloyl-ACP methyl ester carboxylesterase